MPCNEFTTVDDYLKRTQLDRQETGSLGLKIKISGDEDLAIQGMTGKTLQRLSWIHVSVTKWCSLLKDKNCHKEIVGTLKAHGFAIVHDVDRPEAFGGHPDYPAPHILFAVNRALAGVGA